MTDRPIIFSAAMVLALLDGRKAQTRRILKPQPEPFDALFSDAGRWWTGEAETGEVHQRLRVPFVEGDRLWVREAFRGDRIYDDTPPYAWNRQYRVWHEADRDNCDAHGRLRPSIHMPRWASRLTLTVTDVRIQRLQEISEEDALAEGVESWGEGTAFVRLADAQTYSTPRGCFAVLWDSIHGPEAWAADPWVAAVSFSVQRRNIDA